MLCSVSGLTIYYSCEIAPVGHLSSASSAQADFRKARWQAVVKPVDTSATVSASGPVTLSAALREKGESR